MLTLLPFLFDVEIVRKDVMLGIPMAIYTPWEEVYIYHRKANPEPSHRWVPEPKWTKSKHRMLEKQTSKGFLSCAAECTMTDMLEKKGNTNTVELWWKRKRKSLPGITNLSISHIWKCYQAIKLQEKGWSMADRHLEYESIGETNIKQ